MVTAERTSNPRLTSLQTNLECPNTNSHSNLTIYNKRTANLKHLNPVITAIVTTELDGERSDSFSISITQQHSLYWTAVELQKPCGYTSCLYRKPVLSHFYRFTSFIFHDRHNVKLYALLILFIPFLSQPAWGPHILQTCNFLFNPLKTKRRPLHLRSSTYRAVNTFQLGYKNQSVYAASGTSRCLFSDKYKTHKYVVGRTYSC